MEENRDQLLAAYREDNYYLKRAMDRQERELERLTNELQKYRIENERLLAEVNGLRSSRSWRITAPLRKLKKLIVGE